MRAEGASNTARVIAAATILLDSMRDPSVAPAPGAASWCRVFMSGVPADRLLAATASSPFTRWFWLLVEWVTLPGIIRHYRDRKLWIESRCRSAIAEGFNRVVVIGAGYDTLAIRLCGEFPDIEFIEVDHPATQAAKRAALVARGENVPRNLAFVPSDLTAGDFLPPGDAPEPTLCIMEGLLMYLPEARVSKLLDDIRARGDPRVRVIFSFMSRWPDGGSGFRPDSRIIGWWLSMCKEPFKWAIAPEDIQRFLASAGFFLSEMALAPEVRAEAGTAPANLEGENLLVCESAS